MLKIFRKALGGFGLDFWDMFGFIFGILRGLFWDAFRQAIFGRRARKNNTKLQTIIAFLIFSCNFQAFLILSNGGHLDGPA